MILEYVSASEKRACLRSALGKGHLLQFPGAFSPLISMLVEKTGFDGIYISGAGISSEAGLPDIGLTNQEEVVRRAHQITGACNLPSIVDIDTGFGEPLNAARTLIKLEESGIAGCHIEDQLNPKRCGHLDNKSLVPINEMCLKLRALAHSKRDENFLIIARTDAFGPEGLDKAIERSKAYVDAGADLIFPEALENESDFEAFRKAIKVPLIANMTEFGKSPLFNTETLEALGFNIVIYPMSAMRIALKAIEEGLCKLKADGTQEGIISKMWTRKELYELLQYSEYNKFDQNIFNFNIVENKN